MYSETSNKVTFFIDDKKENTDKMVFGRISIRTGKDQNGNAVYENWPVRFVGKAYASALTLPDKSFIEITQWSAHNIYNKETGKGYSYLLVTAFNMAG